MHSFLLIGQSNMAGRGFLNEAKEIDTTHIFILRNGRWQKMFRPVHPDRSFAGVCLAESFAEAYANKYGIDVGLIPCADGGTSLDQWKKGELLYDNAVNNARLAMRTSTIAGILWHQGEADARPELASTYRVRFEEMIYQLQKDIGINVPVIIGELGSFLRNFSDGSLREYTLINSALKEISDNNLSISLVSAEGLTSNPDNLHFTAESLYEFGLRYFAEFDKLHDFEKFNSATTAEDTKRTKMEEL